MAKANFFQRIYIYIYIYIYLFYLSTHINKIYFNRYEKYEIETSCINFMRIILLQILRCEKKTTAYLEI